MKEINFWFSIGSTYTYLTVNTTEKSGNSISVTSRRKTLLQTAI